MADNDNLDLKRRARRRLVGAAALALLAALVLPMIMDDEPDLPAHDIQITIPDRAAESTLARPIGGLPMVIIEDDLVLPEAESEPAGTARDAPAPAPPELPPIARPAPPVAAPPEARQPTATPLPPAAPMAPPRPQPAPPVLDEAARVQAILEGRMRATPPASGQFMVQVGAFAERDKAESMRQALMADGFEATIEESGGVNRVRVGPFDSREAAERAEARLAAGGRPGVVIAR